MTHDYKQEDINAALQELINIAYNKKGAGEMGGNDNNTEFNTWYYGHQVSGSNYAWCSVFVLWCMNQARMLNGKHILPEYQECYDNCMSGVRNLVAYYSLKQKYHCIKNGEDDEKVVKRSGAYPKAYTQIIYDNYTSHNGDFIVFDNGGTETDIYEEIDTNEIKPTEMIESTR